MEPKTDLDARLEGLLGLHESVELVYMVDGYRATYLTKDGDVLVAMVEGRTPIGALENLAHTTRPVR